MNPNKYFKIFLALNTSVLVILLFGIIYNNYKNNSDLVHQELVLLIKNNKENILSGNYRDLITGLSITDDQYFLSLFSKKSGVNFKNGNSFLMQNGQCRDEDFFDYKIQFCKEKFNIDHLIYIFFVAAAIIFLFYVLLFVYLNLNMKRSFFNLFDSTNILYSKNMSLDELWKKTLRLAEEYELSREKIINFEKQKTFSELTSKVAHDIRSPLIALNMIREKIEKNSEAHHLLDITVQRIQTIASDVLKNRKEIMDSKPTSCITASIDMVLEEVFQEKKLIYPNIVFKKIKNESSEKSFFAQVKTTSKPDELGRIFSNLIDNSAQALMEAKVKNAEIQYEMICENDQFLIQVFDNGPGIKAEILPFIGDKEVTTKSDGNGIALAYAKKLLASWGGDLFFESELNKFTKVTIKLLRV